MMLAEATACIQTAAAPIAPALMTGIALGILGTREFMRER